MLSIKRLFQGRRTFIHKSALIDKSVSIWENSKIRENVIIGPSTTIGRNVYVGPGVIIGQNVKIQNNALIYEPAVIGNNTFIGPSVILTNDKFPRSTNKHGQPKTKEDWTRVGVTVMEGCSISAGTVCIAPIILGAWSMTGAGAVVTKDVPAHALVLGNPARFSHWIGKLGEKLVEKYPGIYISPLTLEEYELIDTKLGLKSRNSAKKNRSKR